MSEASSPELLVQGRMEVRLASSPDEVRAAQRLRFEVFNLDQGIGLSDAVSSGLDEDEFDPYCEHLLVVDNQEGRVVGTYRMLPPDRVPPFGYYSETEFDLTKIRASGLKVLELGRSCVAPGRRDGRIIDMLFRGLGVYSRRTGTDALMGCASIHGRDIELLRQVYAALVRERLLVGPELTVTPLATHVVPGVEIPPEDFDAGILERIPPLFRAYLSLGARVGGLPAYDALFKTTDFFILLILSQVTEGYARRFLAPE